MTGHKVRSHPSPASAVPRLPGLDADELAGLVLSGIAEADQPTGTWGIL